MRKPFPFVALAVFLFACTQNSPQENTATPAGSVMVDTVAILSNPANNLNIQTHSFTEIDSSGILMFPLSMGEKGREGNSYKEVPAGHYWNIIFYNTRTAGYHLLSERKMLISSYDASYSRSSHPAITSAAQHLFYVVTVDDYNEDKRLTTEDPAYLFVTDKEGRNFRQLSPAGYHLRSWQFIPSANKVVMTVAKDSNNNKKFGEKEEVASFEIDMSKGAPPVEIFSNAFKNKLKLLYDRDWKQIEQ